MYVICRLGYIEDTHSTKIEALRLTGLTYANSGGGVQLGQFGDHFPSAKPNARELFPPL